MAKHDILLKAFQDNLNKWVCRLHNSGGANQPAATFREIKKRGYVFEEVSSSRWDKSMYCDTCKANTTHSKLLFKEPQFDDKPRISINLAKRKHIIQLLNNRDAFTGASISSTPEIDHKIPWTRLDNDINTNNLSDKEILQHFQLLTREHNLLKDRACGHCKINNFRPPFLGINYWYEGNQIYTGSCEGCGWYDGKKWREEINKLTINNV